MRLISAGSKVQILSGPPLCPSVISSRRRRSLSHWNSRNALLRQRCATVGSRRPVKPSRCFRKPKGGTGAISNLDMPHQNYQSCIDACNNCTVACEHCATECLQEQDIKAMARCIELDRACATICATAARFMASGSEFARRLCGVCAEICQACGDECGKHQAQHC